MHMAYSFVRPGPEWAKLQSAQLFIAFPLLTWHSQDMAQVSGQIEHDLSYNFYLSWGGKRLLNRRN